MQIVGIILLKVIYIYLMLLFARVILSWVELIFPRFNPPKIIGSIFGLIYLLTDPPIRLAGRFLKPLWLGGIGIDLGFLAVFITLILLQRLVVIIFF